MLGKPKLTKEEDKEVKPRNLTFLLHKMTKNLKEHGILVGASPKILHSLTQTTKTVKCGHAKMCVDKDFPTPQTNLSSILAAR